jgi:hypothetical protein
MSGHAERLTTVLEDLVAFRNGIMRRHDSKVSIPEVGVARTSTPRRRKKAGLGDFQYELVAAHGKHRLSRDYCWPKHNPIPEMI